MLKFELNRLTSYDDAALPNELRRVAQLISDPYITQAAFNEHSKASVSAIRRRFKGWRQALEKADLADRYSGTVVSQRMIACKAREYSDNELIAELRSISEKLQGSFVTVDLFNQHARINAETVRRSFGSWWNAIKKAGLQVSNRGKRYSDDDYFENLLAVWTHFGRQPIGREMDELPSWIPFGAYKAKWGNWTKALLAFIARVNSDSPAQEQIPETVEPALPSVPKKQSRGTKRQKVETENQRKGSLGLRYSVLKRDRFRCVLCGASPATQVGCVLHVDHIIPFCRGGLTTMDNLRTTCEPCNLGKSDKPEN